MVSVADKYRTGVVRLAIVYLSRISGIERLVNTNKEYAALSRYRIVTGVKRVG